jgi:hypothetical protein
MIQEKDYLEAKNIVAAYKKQNSKLVSFELTMPNVGSWNGKWTGEGEKYYIIQKCSSEFIENLKNKHNWYYNFGDGWGANVRAEIIESKEAAVRRKMSAGFSGYDWMVDSIIVCGEIKS